MSATVTQRDAVKRERAAFIAGAMAYGKADHTIRTPEGDDCEACAALRREAMNRYPMPTVERRRVLADPHNHEPHWGRPREWTCVNGQLASRTIGLRPGYDVPTLFSWNTVAQVPPTLDRVALWADLLANPTELVDDDTA